MTNGEQPKRFNFGAWGDEILYRDWQTGELHLYGGPITPEELTEIISAEPNLWVDLRPHLEQMGLPDLFTQEAQVDQPPERDAA